MRRGEIAKLTWDQLDLERRVIFLEDTKNGENRLVPLSLAASAALKQHREDQAEARRLAIEKLRAKKIEPDLTQKKWNDARVFRMRPDSITQAFARAKERAREKYEQKCKEEGIQPVKGYLANVTFHDNRHEATSRIADKVDNLVELASVTGHKDLQMLKRYYHPKIDDLVKKLG